MGSLLCDDTTGASASPPPGCCQRSTSLRPSRCSSSETSTRLGWPPTAVSSPPSAPSIHVAVHTVSVAVELGDPAYALDQAKRVHLSRLPVPERRAHHLLDVARAHEQCKQDSEAVELVLAAEQLAPEEVRLRPAARAMVSDILHRAPVVGHELRELAHRLAAT
jgi:hypothetical protein